MNCTIYTDASLKDGDVGVAYWCRSNAGRFNGKVRVPKDYNLNIQEAEAFAVLCALREVNRYWPWVSRFYLNTDNKTVVDAINARTKRDRDHINFYGNSKGEWFDKILEAIRKHLRGRDYEARYVRAHTGRKDIRSWLNDWADQAAREARQLTLE